MELNIGTTGQQPAITSGDLMERFGARWDIQRETSAGVWSAERRSPDGHHIRVIVGRSVPELAGKLETAELAEPVTAVTASRDSGRLRQMQAYEDAVCWRTGRLAAPCADCAAVPAGRCDDHGRDVNLIAEYRQAACQLGQAEVRGTEARP